METLHRLAPRGILQVAQVLFDGRECYATVRAGLVCLYQKAQVQDDMQTTHTITVEHMLESADHLIERHQGESQAPGIQEKEAPLPEGWVLHSATYGFGRAKKGWNVELMDTTRPFQKGSFVNARDNGSLVAALQKANDKIQSGSAGRA